MLRDDGAKFDAVWRSMMAILPAKTRDRTLIASMAAERAVSNITVSRFSRKYKIRFKRAKAIYLWVSENLLAFEAAEDALAYVDEAMR